MFLLGAGAVPGFVIANIAPKLTGNLAGRGGVVEILQNTVLSCLFVTVS